VITVNGVLREVDGMNVTTVLADLGIETRGIAVAINGEVVRRSDWGLTALADGDHVEVVTAAAGG
jgi:sulfur carrier protein